ncbi:carbon-nitrogen hydrolase family protein [Nesterenkonia sp. CL21]|uniref:carbon-nitrogen hydrolase family protein n=1 Tax=unclassified Nesterenkonia TaxID=2629769 RepID=UPI002878A5ED|nr:carbon-nitrogen hydrolase family protein [Nesterenkonia sp. CL21]MDS2174215.1 carbon-nitrogen hydrolase family protein [Nesterenkonia sp. CL21]
MKIAVAQVLSTEDPQVNLELIRTYTARAVQQGADAVVFPEAMHCAFGNPLVPIAEETDGPWAQEVRSIAGRHGVLIIAGMFTPGTASGAGRPRVRNTLLAVGRGVDVTYDKIHLYDAFGFRESDTVEPGATPQLIRLDGVTLGLATCYDVRFPALFQHYAREGADAVVVSASWGAGEGKIRQWETLVRARALDATCHVVACDQPDPWVVGREPVEGAPTGVGHSAVIGPAGQELAVAGTGNELILATVDPTVVVSTRQVLPVLANGAQGEKAAGMRSADPVRS